jgi:branched-chain amino acid aminotransferase
MGMATIGDVIVNGERVPAARAAIPVEDIGLLRGYGCFEALRSYDGLPFRLGEHLDRLERSAEGLRLPLPPRRDIEAWTRDRAAVGDSVVRVVVTGGTDLDELGAGSSTIVFAHEYVAPGESIRLDELAAPWHPAGAASELSGVKVLSYAPNTAALLRARGGGFDDAVLLDAATTVLELPMASIAWVVDGVVETPSLDLGILRSVTRNAMIEVAGSLGVTVLEGRFPATRMHAADEAFVMSTTKEILPAVLIGSRNYDPGPITAALATGFRALVVRELATGAGSGLG